MVKLWGAASFAALLACVVEYYLPSRGPIVKALFVLSTYGAGYFAVTYLLRIKVCMEVIGKIMRRFGIG